MDLRASLKNLIGTSLFPLLKSCQGGEPREEIRKLLRYALSRLHELPANLFVSIHFSDIAPQLAAGLDLIRDDLAAILGASTPDALSRSARDVDRRHRRRVRTRFHRNSSSPVSSSSHTLSLPRRLLPAPPHVPPCGVRACLRCPSRTPSASSTSRTTSRTSSSPRYTSGSPLRPTQEYLVMSTRSLNSTSPTARSPSRARRKRGRAAPVADAATRKPQ